MWDSWFHTLSSTIQQGGAKTTVKQLFEEAESSYYRDNMYELSNAVKARVYVPLIWSIQFSFPGQKDDTWDPWHIDLTQALLSAAPAPGGDFSYTVATELQ